MKAFFNTIWGRITIVVLGVVVGLIVNEWVKRQSWYPRI